MNKKSLLFIFGVTLCTLCSCKPQRTHNYADAASDSTVVADTCGPDAVDTCTTTSSPSTTSSSSTESSESDGGIAYKAGYDEGVVDTDIYDLAHFTDNNYKLLKEKYLEVCTREARKMKREYASNRTIYEEFRRGFIQAYKDYEDAKNAL